MWVAETNTLDEIWNQLQAPGYPTVIEPGYWMLLAALDMGWNVESRSLCARAGAAPARASIISPCATPPPAPVNGRRRAGN